MPGFRTNEVLFIGSVALVVAAPTLIGSVHPETQLLLASGALFLAIVGTVHWRLRGMSVPASGVFWILGGLSAAIALQLAAWPEGLRRFLDPEGAALLGGLFEKGAWAPLAWDRPAGVVSLMHHLGCAAVVLLVCGACRGRQRARLMAWTLDVAFLAIAFCSAIHLFTRASRIWWVYRPEWWEGFMAPFVNQNHAAALFLVSACLHVGLCFSVGAERRRWALMPLALMPCFLVMQSHSRAAFVGLCAGLGLLLLLMWRQGRLTGKTFLQVLLATGIGLMALLPSVSLVRKTFGRRDTTALMENQKVQAWRDSLSLVRRHPVTGVGRGSFQTAFSRYKRFKGEVTVTHAENLPLQLACEMGLLVLAALLFGVAFCLARYFRRARMTTVDCVAVAALGGLFVQNLADFNLEFPGTAYVAMALFGLLAARHMDRTRAKRARGTGERARLLPYLAVWAVLAGGVATAVLAAVWAVPRGLRAETRPVERAVRQGRWDRARRLALAALKNHPADYYLHLLAGLAESNVRKGTPLKWLNNALRLNPSDPRPHLVIAQVLFAVGKPRQSALEYRRAFERGASLTDSRMSALVRVSTGVRRESGSDLAACNLAWQAAGLGVSGVVPGAFHLVWSGGLELDSKFAGALLTMAMPARAGHWFGLAEALGRRGFKSEAGAVLQALSDMWPERTEPLVRLIRYLRGQGHDAEAYQWSMRMLEMSTSEEAFFEASQSVQAAEGNQRARALLLRGIRFNPYGVQLVVAAARIALREGDYEFARSLVRKRLESGGLALADRAALLSVLVEVAERRGRGDQALRLRREIEKLRLPDSRSGSSLRK